MSTVTIRPTFLLRGIDPQEVLERYLNNEFQSIVAPTKKILIDQVDLALDRNVTNDRNAEIYEVSNRSEQRQRIATVNHQAYTYGLDNPIVKRCRWCRCEIEGKVIGIPIMQEYDPVTKNSIFHVDGRHCRFECVYADLISRTQMPWGLRQGIYCSSETLLLRLFDMIYPGKKLCPAQMWDLLNSNGGPFTTKEYFAISHFYHPLSTIRLYPVKREYLMVKQSKAKINIKAT